MRQCLSSRKILFCLHAFFLFSWPFVFFPLTDGDIVNWSKVSVAFQQGEPWLSGGNDQGHGPLMAWTGAFFLSLFGQSFYGLNAFNLLCGVLGVFLMLFFAERLWEDKRIAGVSTFLMVSCIAPVYLSRTPMYDWPATIFYFAFVGFYLLSIKEKRLSFYLLALVAIGIGSLSRFSISLGLAGIFMMCVRLFIHRDWLRLIRDGVAILGVVLLFNLPWLIGQIQTYGDTFVQTFIYDNTGRYVKSTRPDATFRADFYGFPLYVCVGLLPFTFCFLTSFFQRGIVKKILSDKYLLAMICGFLPCLILFSFSGHTKLGRYISYVFPCLFLALGTLLVKFDLSNEAYRKRCATMLKWTAVFLSGLLIQQTIQFFSHAQDSFSFVIEVAILLFALLYLAHWTIVHKWGVLLASPERLLVRFALVYFFFFTALSIEMYRAPFLIWVRQGIEGTLG